MNDKTIYQFNGVKLTPKLMEYMTHLQEDEGATAGYNQKIMGRAMAVITAEMEGVGDADEIKRVMIELGYLHKMYGDIESSFLSINENEELHTLVGCSKENAAVNLGNVKLTQQAMTEIDTLQANNNAAIQQHVSNLGKGIALLKVAVNNGAMQQHEIEDVSLTLSYLLLMLNKLKK